MSFSADAEDACLTVHNAQNVSMGVTEDAPDAELRVLSNFQLSSKGGSRIKLYGDPKITILDFLDTSMLEKEKN